MIIKEIIGMHIFVAVEMRFIKEWRMCPLKRDKIIYKITQMHTLYAPSPIKSTIQRLQLHKDVVVVVVSLPSNYNNKNTIITASYFYILIR